jgi:hypothetical protein
VVVSRWPGVVVQQLQDTMAHRGRPTTEITLSAEERATLQRWAQRHSSSQALALRAKIVLACAEGKLHGEIAARLGEDVPLVVEVGW